MLHLGGRSLTRNLFSRFIFLVKKDAVISGELSTPLALLRSRDLLYWGWAPGPLLPLAPCVPPSRESWLEGKRHPTADQNTKWTSTKQPALSTQPALPGSGALYLIGKTNGRLVTPPMPWVCNVQPRHLYIHDQHLSVVIDKGYSYVQTRRAQ